MTRAEEAALKAYPVDICGYTVECRVGAKPQPQDWNEIRRTHFQEGYKLAEKDLGWHPASEHPPVDEEVIVLIDNIPICPTKPDPTKELEAFPIYKIAFGHIVDTQYCKDFNGWNIPGVCWWMPMPKLPNEDD